MAKYVLSALCAQIAVEVNTTGEQIRVQAVVPVEKQDAEALLRLVQLFPLEKPKRGDYPLMCDSVTLSPSSAGVVVSFAGIKTLDFKRTRAELPAKVAAFICDKLELIGVLSQMFKDVEISVTDDAPRQG